MAERTRKHRTRNVPAHPGNSRLPEDGNFASAELLRVTRLRVSTLQSERKRVAATVHYAQLGVFAQAASPTLEGLQPGSTVVDGCRAGPRVKSRWCPDSVT